MNDIIRAWLTMGPAVFGWVFGTIMVVIWTAAVQAPDNRITVRVPEVEVIPEGILMYAAYGLVCYGAWKVLRPHVAVIWRKWREGS